MKQLKRMLCLLLVCVMVGGLLPMTAAAEDIKITAMEFTVENLNVGEKGSALKATVAGDAPITLSGLVSLRYDSAGEAGGLVKSDLLQEGKIYWLCINLVVKAGYSLTPYIMLQKESWTINGLPYGVAIDKVVQSGSQVRFRLTPMKPVPAFVLQPAGGTVENETDACRIDWSVNFVPVKYECYCGASRFMYSVGTIEGKVFWESITPNHYNDFMIRAYYGTGANEYVDSNRFTVRVPGMYVIIPDTQGGDPVATGWPVTNKQGKLETLPVTENGIMIFDGWYTAPTGGTKVTTDTVFEADSTIYARWKAPATYNIIAGNNGVYQLGSSADKLSFTIDCDFSKFTGVEWNGNMLDPSNYTVKAGKSGTTVLELKKAFLETLTPEAYAFRIYYSDGNAYPKFSVKEATVTYTVTFESDGGSAVAAQTVEKGKAATKPADPTKSGYTFKGWYLSGTAYDFSKPVAGNITLKAKWEKVVVSPVTYTITFDPNGGSVTPTSKQTDAAGWLQGLPTPTHSNPNKLFDGWHTSKTSYSRVADKCKFSKDTTLYAHWKDKPAHTIAEVHIESIQIPAAGVMPNNQVNITTSGVQGITDSGDTFWVRYDAATNNLTDTYEDDTHVDSVPFRSAETYLLMLVMEAQPNYGFTPDVKVFYKGKELPAPNMSDITASAMLDHDDEYIVVIINPGKVESTTYTVTFNSDGGSAVAKQTVEKDKAVAKPADPTKEGYTFQGWYLGSDKYDFSKLVTGDITLTAKWEKKQPAHTHSYSDGVDGTCNGCGIHREEVEIRQVVHMFRMYNPNTGEHFYTGSTEERDNLIGHGWQYEGVGFTFPANTGDPVYRLFQPSTGEHLYTMDKAEKEKLEAEGWNYEGIAFNSAYDTEAVQHRLHNPNATVGAYHFTFSLEEKQNLIDAGWEYQGIGWYSCWK